MMIIIQEKMNGMISAFLINDLLVKKHISSWWKHLIGNTLIRHALYGVNDVKDIDIYPATTTADSCLITYQNHCFMS